MTSLAIHITHLFFHFNSFRYYDRYVSFIDCEVTCAGALFLSCKILDMLVNVKDVCAKHHKVYKKYINNLEKDILDDALCNALKEKICIAESALLKTLNYELNFDMPYLFLDDLCKRYYRETHTEIYHVSRLIQLDIFRSGASLFYNNINLAIAAFMAAIKIQYDVLTPLHVRSTAQKQESTVENKESQIEVEKSDNHVNGVNGHHLKEEEILAPADMNQMQTEKIENEAADDTIHSKIEPEANTEALENQKKPSIENELVVKQESPKAQAPDTLKNLTIPELFPLGLELSGSRFVHPVEDPTGQTDPESDELMMKWFAELEKPNINPDHIFGTFPFI